MRGLVLLPVTSMLSLSHCDLYHIIVKLPAE